MEDAYSRALSLMSSLGAAEIEHPGGFLLEHLQRVEARLANHGADDTLRLAGLTHAVYGTDGFDVRLLGVDERDTLAQVVGGEAEALVYLYAACDRARTWPTLGRNREVHDRWTSQVIRPAGDQLVHFIDLTIVNELDVVDHAPGMKESSGTGLRGLVRSWQGLASPRVTADGMSTLSA